MPLVPAENTYATLEQADAYFSLRVGAEGWGALSVFAKEALLATSTIIVDEREWIGQVANDEQSLSWPRKNACYYDPKRGKTIVLSDTEIPDRVVKATLEQALHLLINDNPEVYSRNKNYETIKIGPIELTDNTDERRTPRTPSARLAALLGPLTVFGGSNTWFVRN
jgi:hypothetical protein